MLRGLPILGYFSDEGQSRWLTDERLTQLTGPLALVGATTQVQPQAIAGQLSRVLWGAGRSIVVDVSDSHLDGPAVRAQVLQLSRRFDATLLTGPSVPSPKADLLLLSASAALLLVPARDALVPELYKAFDLVARSGTPVIGVLLIGDPHAPDRRL